MPWQDFFDVKEAALVRSPDARIHHLGHQRLAALLEWVARKAAKRSYPHMANAIDGSWHILQRPGQPLHGLYVETHNYITQAVATIDRSAGQPGARLSDALDHHCAQLLERIKRHL